MYRQPNRGLLFSLLVSQALCNHTAFSSRHCFLRQGQDAALVLGYSLSPILLAEEVLAEVVKVYSYFHWGRMGVYVLVD